jgi:hypothetical protein
MVLSGKRARHLKLLVMTLRAVVCDGLTGGRDLFIGRVARRAEKQFSERSPHAVLSPRGLTLTLPFETKLPTCACLVTAGLCESLSDQGCLNLIK